MNRSDNSSAHVLLAGVQCTQQASAAKSIIFAAAKPSDVRSVRNLRAMLRRAGGFEARGL
jgi:hypothetical protein